MQIQKTNWVVSHLIIFTLFMLMGFNALGSHLISPVQDSALFEILNLRPKTARKILETEKNKKFDLFNEYLYNWSEALELTLTGDETLYKKYLDTFEKRLERIDQFADKSDQLYQIILADIYTHGAMVNIMYNDYLSGFGKLMKANKNARNNEKSYPNCWLNDKLCGSLNVSFASLSPFWQKVAGIFSLNGDEKKGFTQLDQYLETVKNYKGLYAEGTLYYGSVLKIAKDEQRALEMLNSRVKKETSPALAIYLTANVLSFNYRSAEALNYLNYFPQDKIEIPFSHFDYLYGKVKLNRLDIDSYKYLNKYLNSSKLKVYRHEITYKIAQYYLIQGKTDEYKRYTEKLKSLPKASIERDREALAESYIQYIPDLNLMKSRFLVQGGFYEMADSILVKTDVNLLKHQEQKDEFQFLKASISQSRNKATDALNICDLLIRSGMNNKNRFPAETALLAGNICLQKKDLKRAEAYFNIALDMDGNDDVFTEVTHRRAKNQLGKIRKKQP